MNAEMLKFLRCPVDPRRKAELVLEDGERLLCGRCRLQFRVRDGLPSLIAEEAQLPPGCPALEDLPCRKGG